MAEGLILRVNGREYGGWKSASVTRGIEAIAGGFELSVSDRWAEQGEPWPINEEDDCELVIDGETIIQGAVDRVTLSFSGITISGRDRTGDMVDCSAILSKWEFRNVPLLTLAKQLAEPFGISVTMQAGLAAPAVAKLTIDPGDTAFDALERVCRAAGVLPISDGRGGLVLTRAGSGLASTALVEGQNILADASATFDCSGRFRRYIVLGQHPGSDEFSGGAAAAIRGECTDMGVERSARVLVVRPEGAMTSALAKVRAQWEAKVRAGRAASVTIPVQGWRQGDGTLWPVNALVPVQSRRLGIGGQMLITQAVYSLDESGGKRTALNLRPPNAYIPEPVIASDRSKPKGKRWKDLDAIQPRLVSSH